MSDTSLHSRVCTCCLIEKPDCEFYAHPTGLRRRYSQCKMCCKIHSRSQKRRESHKRWNDKHRKEIYEWIKKYRSTPIGRQKGREYKIKYRSTPHGRQKIRELDAKYRNELYRGYVVRNLIQHTALKTKDVPLPLIEAARAAIRLKRYIWQNQKT